MGTTTGGADTLDESTTTLRAKENGHTPGAVRSLWVRYGTKISGNLPTDFGFVIDIHSHEPETIYVIPIKSDGEHYVHEGKLRVFRSKTGGNEWEALTKGLPQENCYVNVLRDAMAVDTLDKCGIYFGTTGGQVYMSPDAGDSWSPIVRDLPAVLSVEVQTLA